IGRRDDLDAVDRAVGNAGRLDRLVHALERRPGAGESRHRPAVERVVDDLLHPAGLRIGIITSTKWNSDWCAVVEDSAVWSSPISARTPPCFEVPARLAWRNTSPERSTPGPLPYHMPKTPSYLPSPRNSACCVPHSAVAARSSLSPVWNLMLAAAN